MAHKISAHIIKGLNQDLSDSKLSTEYACDALNIRITNREDSTLLSITNEKGNTPVIYKSEESTIYGKAIGYGVINNYLIVFTTSGIAETTPDRIYRIDFTNDPELKCLYSGNLNFSMESTIETISIYESNLIQKIYWVDGINQPRVINIVKDLLLGKDPEYNDQSFNFTQDLKLEENISISKIEASNGVFSPGTIQYAFTYYNKYGQESNIFYTSGLYYISDFYRGGNPEEKIANAFSINIDNIENSFDYVRVYSIHRTSLNATPVAKIVTDLYIGDSNTLNYIDNGTTGNDIDPSMLLYIGGEDLVAGTITHKDSTLFLGNIKFNRQEVPEEIKSIITNSTSISEDYRSIELPTNKGSYYSYSNQLNTENTSYFKSGEHYRLGVQLQYKNGKWTDPIMIKSAKKTKSYFDMPIGMKPSIIDSEDNTILKVPVFKCTLPEAAIDTIKNLGYKKVRPVVVLPSIYDRKVVMQGMLCPTVFNIGSRRTNAPFSQASWFIRPNPCYSVGSLQSNDENIEKGAWVEFRHWYPLKSNLDRGGEIQNLDSEVSFGAVNASIKGAVDDNIYDHYFYVDQSVITFHSPEIEFDDATNYNTNNLKMRIVGVINFTSSIGNIDIKTTSPTIKADSTGFYKKDLGTPLQNAHALRSLVSGLFYKDYYVDDTDSNFKPNDKQSHEYGFMIYPWHRSGSLNNDIVRPDNKGARSAVLKTKKIANLKYSSFNTFLETPWEAYDEGNNNARGVSQLQIFNSNEVSLSKIKAPKNSKIDNINYYGNVDTLLVSQNKYNLVVGTGNEFSSNFFDTNIKTIEDTSSEIGDIEEELKVSREPIRMKYKSSPHAVFTFNNSLNTQSPVILPSVNAKNIINNNIIPFWDNIIQNIPEGGIDSIDFTALKYVQDTNPAINNSDILEGELWLDTTGYDKDPSIGYIIYKWSGTSSVAEGEEERAGWETYPIKDGEYFIWTEPLGGNHYYKTIDLGGVLAAKEADDINTPEDINYGVKQGDISIPSLMYPYLFLAEFYRDDADIKTPFGGDSESAILDNIWIPANTSSKIEDAIEFKWGDTWYQRYDHLKTYPFTQEDENQIVEIASFMCETRVNIDGRYDKNRGLTSNLNISNTNFNLHNSVYSQQDNFFNYRVLDKDYYKNINFPNSITWSKEKFIAEEIDTWTNINFINTLELDGDKGKITALKTFNNRLLCFQNTGISDIMFNSRVQIPVSDGVPIEISNGYKVDGKNYLSSTIGSSNKNSIVTSSRGIYFVNTTDKGIYLLSEGISNLSDVKGMTTWCQNNDIISTFIDSKNEDVYFITKKDALCFSQKLGEFTSFMSYGDTPFMFNIKDSFYSLYNKDNAVLWENFKGDYNSFYGEVKPFSVSIISNQDPFNDKTFTNIEFRSDMYNSKGTLLEESFDKLTVENEYQFGESTLDYNNYLISNLKKKFRIWRADIPRDTNHPLDRIRNTWTKVTLRKDNPEDKKIELHDILVHYYM